MHQKQVDFQIHNLLKRMDNSGYFRGDSWFAETQKMVILISTAHAAFSTTLSSSALISTIYLMRRFCIPR